MDSVALRESMGSHRQRNKSHVSTIDIQFRSLTFCIRDFYQHGGAKLLRNIQFVEQREH